MRVLLVDPPAFTPPYDHALASALAAAGADVELVTHPVSHVAVRAVVARPAAPPAGSFRRSAGVTRLVT